MLYNRIIASIQLSQTDVWRHVYWDWLADLERRVQETSTMMKETIAGERHMSERTLRGVDEGETVKRCVAFLRLLRKASDSLAASSLNKIKR